MKQTKFILLTLVLFGFSIIKTFGQSKSYLMANHLFEQGEYAKAIPELKKSINHKKNLFYNDAIYYKLGEAERILNDTIINLYYEESIHLAKEYDPCGGVTKKFRVDKIRRIAFCLYYIERHNQSLQWITKYLKIRPEDCEAQNLKEELLTIINANG